jgi:MFS family permease
MDRRARPGTYAGLFFVTLSTLMYEIVLTRIFSVTTWYHFAFVAISVALFGMTVGALLVFLLPHRFTDRVVTTRLWVFALLFGITVAVCFVTQLSIPFDPKLNVVSAWSVFVTCAVISVPFVCSGVVVCLALTRFREQTNRLYAVDLVGAALGCILVVFLFVVLDGPSLVIAIGALAALGSFFFALDANSGRGMATALAVALILAGSAGLNGYLHANGHPLLRIVWTKGQADTPHEYETWNAFSRLTVDTFADGQIRPSGVGLSETMPDLRVQEKTLRIDGNAATALTHYTGDPAETDFLRYDISNLAHNTLTGADVLVIGAGGGRDVLSALEFGQRSVTGVEINPDILRVTNGVYGDFTGHLDRDPRVTFVADEARSYLARTKRTYDLIQISLIDTWASTSAGAFALTENSLYTEEAWNVFLDRLGNDGVLSVSRWYTIPWRAGPLEAYRVVALASAVLKSRGTVNPRDHILVYRRGTAATFLVSPTPFSEKRRGAISAAADRLGFTPILTRSQAADPLFAALTVPEGPDSAIDDVSADISPPTDDRPFFFQMADLGTLLSGAGFSRDESTRPVLVLGLLAVAILSLAIGFIVVPLVVKTDLGAQRGLSPFYVYFVGIGLGFLFIEIAQLQRLSIFLGHPTYALTVVLFSLLVSSGIGSFASERLGRADLPRRARAVLAMLVATVAAVGYLTPVVIEHMDSHTTPVRIATAVVILVPIGFLMGMAFPLGMGAASDRSPAERAFLWGINGAASVCASVFAVAIAVFHGISASYWAGVVAYAIAATAMVVILRRRVTVRDSEPTADEVPATKVSAAA